MIGTWPSCPAGCGSFRECMLKPFAGKWRAGTRWTRSMRRGGFVRSWQPRASEISYRVVGYVHLTRDGRDSERVVEEHLQASGGRFCGVRMIANHHPDNELLTGAQVESGQMLSSDDFCEAMGVLEKHGLSFDLSCHPHQMMRCVRSASWSAGHQRDCQSPWAPARWGR